MSRMSVKCCFCGIPLKADVEKYGTYDTPICYECYLDQLEYFDVSSVNIDEINAAIYAIDAEREKRDDDILF